MKIWLFEAREVVDYDEFSEFVVAADTEEDAKTLIKDRLYDQKVRDFKVREIIPDLEAARVLCESFHAG